MTTADNVLLVLFVLLFQALPLAVVVVPPVVMAVRRRWSLAGVVLWLAGVGLNAAWVIAPVVEMDRVDATGESGGVSSGMGWLLTAAAAATASIVLAARPPRGVRA